MKVNKMPTADCKVGDILATDVVNNKGLILAAKDTVLNDFIISRLIDLGIVHVNIYRHINSYIYNDVVYSQLEENYKNVVLQTKRLLQDITAGRPIEFEEISFISDQIFNSVLESGNIIKLLTEINREDEYTYTHSVNTAFYSMLIAKWLNLSECDIIKAIQSGLLHDVGKTRIPADILNKKGRLTDEEFDIIKKHTILGYEIVKGIEGIDIDIVYAVLNHHERMDGSGYPNHYNAEQMNLYSRIVALADVFDAMTSDRVYKKRATPFEVFNMYLTEGLCLFDTKLLYVFMNHLAINLIGANVLLSNGIAGEIVYVPFHNVTSPIVKVKSEYINISNQTLLKISSMM